MLIGDYLLMLRRRWRIWVSVTLLALVAATLVNVLAPRSYTATATSFVTVAGVESTESSIYQGSQFTVQRVKSYATLVRSRIVLDPVVEELDLELTVPDLRMKVEATSPLDTALVQVSVVDPDPVLARNVANAVSRQLARSVEAIETPRGDTGSQVKVILTNPAETPGGPSFPNTKLNLALGLFAGLALGFVAAVLRHQLDRRVKATSDVRAIIGTSPLGVVAKDSALRSRAVAPSEEASPTVESFRTVRTGLKFATVDTELRHFAVTSAVGAEGKSVLAANLASSWAASGASACLVEADLRRPRVSEYLGVEGAVGLTDVLVGEAVLDDVVLSWRHGLLDVLPAGSLPPDPAALLESTAMHQLVHELAQRYDVVVYDTPPVLAVADALVLAEQLNGAVLAVRSGRTTRDELAASIDLLAKAQIRLLGTVLTFAPASAAPREYAPLDPWHAESDRPAPGSAVWQRLRHRRA